ncbi:MAG: hypothetical protein ACRCWI_06385 [Brevinema sp.]
MTYKYLYFLSLFVLVTTSYTQVNSWVSISNEFLTISMDTVTGRYIIYDNINYHPSKQIDKSFFPKDFLNPASPPPQDTTLSPILGSGTNAFNVTSFNIDNIPVIFGSLSGQWSTPPIIESNSIIYSWKIGTLNIIQRLEIITNSETLFPDAVQISYDVFNNDTDQSRDVKARIILDPVINNGQTNTFFLPNSEAITTEYSASLGVLPKYWITSDATGQLSSLSLKGLMLQKPNFIHITTIDRALKDIWEFRRMRNNNLSGKDTAVILFFNGSTIPPDTSTRIASTIITIPSLIDTFSNNGLEVRTSTFTSQNTTPISINLWLQNTLIDIFDTVHLELTLPPSLTAYTSLVQTLSDIGSGNVYPVTWNIGTESIEDDDYNLIVNVKGYQSGQLKSQFDIPIAININPQAPVNNTTMLTTTIDSAIDSTKETRQQRPNYVQIFESNDTLGYTSESLAEIHQYLQNNNSVENEKIIKMIETEQQLLQEIAMIEKSIAHINIQYQILSGVYKQLYKDNLTVDRDQINIQGLIDNINELEKNLLDQETAISNIIQ